MHKLMSLCLNMSVMIISIKSLYFLLYRSNDYFNNLETRLDSGTNVCTENIEVIKQMNANINLTNKWLPLIFIYSEITAHATWLVTPLATIGMFEIT